MIYIKFKAPKTANISKQNRFKQSIENVLCCLIKRIIPNGNPDFDDKIDFVATWLVELDSKTGIPEREIGLDKNDKVIVKMPFKNNYGYWVDNNLLLADFKEHFEVTEINQDIFEKYWSLLLNDINSQL
ncbi:MAG: hypothetical protein KGV44_06990 [Flavobacteriaceae bacterium]|nr:hypothetical protein [Flavobacteriaceae bacterium]